MLGILVKMTLATEYNLNPMNFPTDSARNITITVNSPGDTISVAYPPVFTLVSGSNTGNDSVLFVVQSPSSSQNGDLYYFNLSINGGYVDHMVSLAVPDNQIVDNKWELGHGDFNYPECNYLPNETSLVFPIIRVWGVGTDVLNAPATNITFTCNYPKLRPRTVDGKFTTDYNDNTYLKATGLLEEWEGASMFRVFVLSQDVDYIAGSKYEVTCGNLTYQFPHETVVAPIPPINISVVGTNPFTVLTSTTSDYVQYLIYNNGQYEVKDIEFTWKYNNLVYRQELDSLSPGDAVKYKIWVNGNPTIEFNIKETPCWMFNSRSPTTYDISRTDIFSVNTNATEIFSVEDKIYYKEIGESALSSQLDDLIFLFKINTEEYHLDISKLPESQQNEANFTCYRLGLSSNGFNENPQIRLQTNATSSSDVIVKNDLFQTTEFDFTQDNNGFGIVSWDANLGLCTKDTASASFVCPKIYNYICLKAGTEFKKEAVVVPETKCIICKEKMDEIGKIVSPTYPSIGFLIIVAIVITLIYLTIYYSDELSLKNWIQNRKSRKQEEDYIKWREEQEKNQGGGLF